VVQRCAPCSSLDPISEALAFLSSEGAAWNMGRQDGVVITIPPAGIRDVTTMGYVAIGATQERVRELRNAIDDFALETFRAAA
jgi:hypothetical protein